MTRVTAQGLIHRNAEAKDSILFLCSNKTRKCDRQDEPKGGANLHVDGFWLSMEQLTSMGMVLV